MLQACETVMKENEDVREKICGNWQSARRDPTYWVYKEGEHYKVTLFRRVGVPPQAEAGNLPAPGGRRTATST